MRLYRKYVSILLKSQLQYRASAIMIMIAQMFIPLSVFASIYLLFERFGSISGYTLYEVALCYAVAHFGFSSAELIFRGFDSFSHHIRTGSFDRLMLRPKGLFFQTLASEFEMSRVGRLIQAVGVFIFVMINISVKWSVLKIFTLCMMLLSSFVIFSGVFVVGAAVCFFTIQGLEVINIFTDGGREVSQYPLSIFKKGFRDFFTFVIPFGAFNYLPLNFLLDKAAGSSLLYAFMPLLCIPFFALCTAIWHAASKKYKSTGS
jgi:ABC-2 type transport system permease protein